MERNQASVFQKVLKFGKQESSSDPDLLHGLTHGKKTSICLPKIALDLMLILKFGKQESRDLMKTRRDTNIKPADVHLATQQS